MAKADKTVFFCKECGYESAKWLGQCPGCKEVGTFVEEPKGPKNKTIRRNITKFVILFFILSPLIINSVYGLPIIKFLLPAYKRPFQAYPLYRCFFS